MRLHPARCCVRKGEFARFVRKMRGALTMIQYLPVLEMKMPWKMAEGEMRQTSGKRKMPLCSGEATLTAWKYAGLRGNGSLR
jgi:hypothetical protein